MKLATFSTAGDPAPRPGALVGDRMIDLLAASPEQGASMPATLLELIARGDEGRRRAADAVRRATTHPEFSHPIAGIRWHSPVPRPSKNIFCLGLNYLAHARESGHARGKDPKIPTIPVLFTKAPTTMTGPFDDVPVDWDVTSQVDWEVELGVIIGRGGRDIARGDALAHVFGYTAINDLSARELQVQHFQWFKGKSLDGFCPMGPVIVTSDEFGDPQRKRLQLRVNGETRQDSSTADMIFPVDAIIESLSRGLTLEPGDIIATGTPEGVGMGRNPPEYLKEGDFVETEVEGVGILRNRIVTYSRDR